jgi:hypothetical protein
MTDYNIKDLLWTRVTEISIDCSLFVMNVSVLDVAVFHEA